MLGEIPLVGGLFRYENRGRRKTNLLVFLRPYVVRDESTSSRWRSIATTTFVARSPRARCRTTMVFRDLQGRQLPATPAVPPTMRRQQEGGSPAPVQPTAPKRPPHRLARCQSRTSRPASAPAPARASADRRHTVPVVLASCCAAAGCAPPSPPPAQVTQAEPMPAPPPAPSTPRTERCADAGSASRRPRSLRCPRPRRPHLLRYHRLLAVPAPAPIPAPAPTADASTRAIALLAPSSASRRNGCTVGRATLHRQRLLVRARTNGGHRRCCRWPRSATLHAAATCSASCAQQEWMLIGKVCAPSRAATSCECA